MATREPRRTAFRIRWHKRPTPDGTPAWYAEMGGITVAEAAMTGRNGVDDYPWDWSLTDYGEAMKVRGRSTGGVCDTLRSVKGTVASLLAPDAWLRERGL